MDPQESKLSAERVTALNHPSGHLVDAGSSTSASMGKGNSSKTCVSALYMLYPAITHVDIFWTASGWTAFLYCKYFSIFYLKGIIQGRIALLSLERISKGWFGHGSYSCIPYCHSFGGSRTNGSHTLWFRKHGISLGNYSPWFFFHAAERIIDCWRATGADRLSIRSFRHDFKRGDPENLDRLRVFTRPLLCDLTDHGYHRSNWKEWL